MAAQISAWFAALIRTGSEDGGRPKSASAEWNSSSVMPLTTGEVEGEVRQFQDEAIMAEQILKNKMAKF